MRQVCYIFILFFYSSLSFANMTLTLNMSKGSMVTKELKDNSGVAGSDNFTVKVGTRLKFLEMGAYSSTSTSKVTVTHDSETSDLSFEQNTLGAYLAFYRGRLYVEMGYGKTSLIESLTSTQTDTQKQIVSDLYNISDLELTGSEMRALLGVRIYSVAEIAFTLYAEKIKLLESSHDSTTFGLGLKVGF